MTHKELFEALLAGKKVFDRRYKINGYYEYLDKEGNLRGSTKSYEKLGEPSDYEIYEELRYQVLYKDGNNYLTTSVRYKSREDFEKFYYEDNKYKFIKLLIPGEQ